MKDLTVRTGTVHLDPAALAELVARQYAAAAVLDACAARLTAESFPTGEGRSQREAAAALHERLAHLAERLAVCSTGVCRLAERINAHAAAVTAADAGAD